MDQIKIGNIIKEIRKNNNLTQKELADILNVTYQAVSKWENGKNMPDIAILKKISTEFNVDISLLLDAPSNNKKNSLMKKVIPFIILLLILIIILFTFRDDDFSFKTLSSECASFNITGSIAFNKDKSSIFISNIDYCGEEDKKIYNKISCKLYEKHNDEIKLISECNTKENVTLDNFLEDLSINVNDYKTACNLYKENDMYIEINATDELNKITKFNIPLKFLENCT